MRTAAAALLAAFVAAPALAQAPNPATTPSAAAPDVYLGRLQSEGERNRVLNQMELGARYFWAGDLDASSQALDDAMLQIERVYGKDAAAQKARSLWYEEGAKTFKGEPYERAMVFYYRGLIYLRKGDYENARAAFRQGLMQDAFAEEEQNQADFAVLLFLDAWASHANGDRDLRDETLAYLKRLRPAFPGIGDKDDTLVLVETGTAPRKLRDGPAHAYLVFRRGKGFTENRVIADIGGQPLPLAPMEDIYWQATTRGGRMVDRINAGKAEFKQTTGQLSSMGLNVATWASEQASFGNLSSDVGDAANVIGAVAAVPALLSFSVKAYADDRQWSSLPDTVHVGTYSSKARPGATGKVRFLKDEAEGAQADRDLTVMTDPNGKRIALVRSR